MQSIISSTGIAAVFSASCCLLSFAVPGAAAEKPVDYNRDIRPILSDNCFACHGPDATHREADLRLDVEESAKDWVIVEEKPAESELVRRITSDDEFERMPPADSGKSLSKDEIELLKKWISQGAPYEPHWAYVPPKKHPLPKVENEKWSKHWIDRYIHARLEEEELPPSPPADPVTLIRRLSFDLTGLPPTPAEVEAFAKNPSEQAYEDLVDRLLASEHFGERMAVYWLDLVRFADTVGYHGDQDHNISPYRDYVIDAFNENLPFDQFTREQLAGDLLPDSTIDQKIASGYNRVLQTSHEGGVQAKEYLAIYAADHVRNLSAVWMGATVGCAQCHDHKYDPYTAKDFYSMAAFFADVDEAQHLKKGADTVPTVRPPEIKVLTKRERQRIAELEEQVQSLKAQQAGEASDDQSGDVAKRVADLEQEIEQIRKSARLTMITESIEPRPMRILPRGNWLDDSGPLVEPAVPEFLGTREGEQPRLTRLDLANWLCDPEEGVGGLTARVMVNRFWHLLFGGGISRSLDDFGGQGEPPSHPELLDRLAIEFYEQGWDTKAIIKQIVMSQAYRQTSLAPQGLLARDPDNRLYARQSRFRLPAEFVRDNALAISGLLNRSFGGPSIKPYQPEGYYRHLNFPKRTYKHHTDERQWRRGVYMHWQRQFLHPMLKAFDAPSREECTAERPRSNTPLAALTLLNDPSFVEASRVFADRVLKEGGATDASRLDFAFRQAVSRTPDTYERELLVDLLDQNRSHYQEHPDDAKELLSTGLAPAPAGDPVEVAAWTSIARAVLNLSETMTRN